MLVAPRAAQRARPDVPGDRAQPRLPGRRLIVVEYVFNYPGIGGALRDGVHNHDIPVVQALAMLIAAIYVVLNLLADVATIIVTPRLQDAPVSAIADTTLAAIPDSRRRRASAPPAACCARALGLWRTRIGLVLVAVLVAIAVFGPLPRAARARPRSSASRTPGRQPALRHRPPRPGRVEPVPLGRRASCSSGSAFATHPRPRARRGRSASSPPTRAAASTTC